MQNITRILTIALKILYYALFQKGDFVPTLEITGFANVFLNFRVNLRKLFYAAFKVT